jgi:NADPH:quinone reductase-like Zn-dependent oxidoreductase
VLKIRERPEPQPGPGEVAIRVRAAGLNFADILARQGSYPDAPRPPCAVGYEVAGTVEVAGDGVYPGLLGTPVLAMTRFGGQAEVVTVLVDQIFAIPAALSFEEAAALPVNYLTAYALLVVMGSLGRGEAVLSHNAGGGEIPPKARGLE